MHIFLSLLALLALAGACFLLLTIYHWHADRTARRNLLYPDASGRYPIPYTSAEAIGAALVAQAQSLAPVPHTLTYSPHISREREHAHMPAVPASLPAPEPEPLPTGTIDLLDLTRDWKPSVESITLAIGPGGTPYRVHARDLCHVALAGATGGGKSNIMRLLLAQILSAGAHVVLADPHFTPYDPESGDDWRAIAGRLHLAPAVKADEIHHLLTWLAADELPKRLERRHAGQHPGAPLFLAIDELPAIVQDVKDAPEQLGRLLREARKVNIFVIGAAQDFLVKTIGGAGAVRDCYRTAFCVGGDAQTARVLLDVRGSVDDGQLRQGLAYLRSKATPTAQLVRVPLASNGAIERLLPSHYEPTTIDVLSTPVRSGSIVAPVAAPATPLPARQEAIDARSERVRELLRAAAPQKEILREVWGITTNGGATYTRASAELREIVAKLV